METNFNLKYVSVAFNKVGKIYSKVNTSTRAHTAVHWSNVASRPSFMAAVAEKHLFR